MPSSRHGEFLAHLPSRWKTVRLQELGAIYAGGTPSRANPSYWNGTIAWLTPGELTDLRSKKITVTHDRITESGLADSSATLLPVGALLVTTRATIGNVAIAGVPISTNQGFKNLVLFGEADTDFYFHLLRFVTGEFVRLASGTTFLEISAREFSSVVVPFPPLPEQRRIAEILDTADEAIQQTERLIAKLKAIRAGLLHDLLTRGLDEHGCLRDPVAQPKQFKDSPLGRIPREWEAVTIESVAANKPHAVVDGPFGSNLKSEHYRDRGVPVIQSGYVTTGEFLADSYVYVGTSLFQAQIRSAVEPGDIVMAKIGAHCGTCALLPEDHPVGILASNSLKISTNRQMCTARYLLRVLHFYYDTGRIDLVKTETAQPAISLKSLRTFMVPLPGTGEQDTIVCILDAHDARIRAEEAALAKLRQVKRGLMDDLLSGRVRVQT